MNGVIKVVCVRTTAKSVRKVVLTINGGKRIFGDIVSETLIRILWKYMNNNKEDL